MLEQRSGQNTCVLCVAACQGCDALVICTSAVPQPQVLPTLLGAAGHWFGQLLRRKSGADDPFVPVATWKGGQTPQQVRLPAGAVIWSGNPPSKERTLHAAPATTTATSIFEWHPALQRRLLLPALPGVRRRSTLKGS